MPQKNLLAPIPVLRPFMPELDSLRGVAILGVLFYHGFYWGIDLTRFSHFKKLFLTATWTGRLGVNLFFVLSGFLITGLLLDSHLRQDYYRRFYVRRILRIVPAYLLTLAVLLISHAAPLNFVFLSLLYLSNLTPLFGVPIAYPVLWSLAVEEHFYIAWPAIVRKASNRMLAAICALIIVLSPLLRLASFYIAKRRGWVSYEIFDYTWNAGDGLASGALLSISLRDFSPSRIRLWRFVTLAFPLAIAAAIVGLRFGAFSRLTASGAALQVVPAHLAFVALLLAFLLLGSGPYRQWSRSPALEFFGRISYGLYLYHLLFFSGFERLLSHGFIRRLDIDPFWGLVIRFLALGTLAVAAAYFSRKFLEEPFLKLKDRLS
jgi:peptidoglycan/LPS O-acetylase OafA/YrhL